MRQAGRWELVSGRSGSGLQTDVLAGGLGLLSWQQADSEYPSRQVVSTGRTSSRYYCPCYANRVQGLASISREERGERWDSNPRGIGYKIGNQSAACAP